MTNTQRYSIELLGGAWRVRDNLSGQLFWQPFRRHAAAQRLVADLESADAAKAAALPDRAQELELVRTKALARLAGKGVDWAQALAGTEAV